MACTLGLLGVAESFINGSRSLCCFGGGAIVVALRIVAKLLMAASRVRIPWWATHCANRTLVHECMRCALGRGINLANCHPVLACRLHAVPIFWLSRNYHTS